MRYSQVAPVRKERRIPPVRNYTGTHLCRGNEEIEKLPGAHAYPVSAALAKLGHQNSMEETTPVWCSRISIPPHPFVVWTVYHMSDNGQIMPLRPR